MIKIQKYQIMKLRQKHYKNKLLVHLAKLMALFSN